MDVKSADKLIYNSVMKYKIIHRSGYQLMRFFNLKGCCVVGHLMLAGILGMPSPGTAMDLATEALPESAASSPPMQGAMGLSVSAEQWKAQEKSPRRGETLVTLPGLLMVMQEVVRQPDSSVMLHYPENERGEVWVEELRDWLVALGLPANRIQLIPGSNGDVINISQGVVMQGAADGKNTPPSVITEPFQIKEATDVVNGVEIP